jgi:hypothetical protein
LNGLRLANALTDSVTLNLGEGWRDRQKQFWDSIAGNVAAQIQQVQPHAVHLSASTTRNASKGDLRWRGCLRINLDRRPARRRETLRHSRPWRQHHRVQAGSDEENVAGLVAYSIYKQNKRAWLDDFVKKTGRAPSEAETRSYTIGESTERRVSTYRRLAASTLAGDAPSRSARRAKGPMSGIAAGALWALVIIVALGVVGLAIHSGYFAGAK